MVEGVVSGGLLPTGETSCVVINVLSWFSCNTLQYTLDRDTDTLSIMFSENTYWDVHSMQYSRQNSFYKVHSCSFVSCDSIGTLTVPFALIQSHFKTVQMCHVFKRWP